MNSRHEHDSFNVYIPHMECRKGGEMIQSDGQRSGDQLQVQGAAAAVHCIFLASRRTKVWG